jgi:hypothetical protein
MLDQKAHKQRMSQAEETARNGSSRNRQSSFESVSSFKSFKSSSGHPPSSRSKDISGGGVVGGGGGEDRRSSRWSSDVDMKAGGGGGRAIGFAGSRASHLLRTVLFRLIEKVRETSSLLSSSLS